MNSTTVPHYNHDANIPSYHLFGLWSGHLVYTYFHNGTVVMELASTSTIVRLYFRPT